LRYFPIFVDLEGAEILIVGGGNQALQKLRLALKTSARITIVARTIDDEIARVGRSGRVRIERRDFLASDGDGKALAFVATGVPEENQAIAAVLRAAKVPVNVVDTPDLSSFITPAIVDRDPVVVAIGTEGATPVIAREIKTKLEAWLPSRLGAVATKAAALRAHVATLFHDGTTRRRFWMRLLAGPFRAAALAGDDAATKAAVEEEIAHTHHDEVTRIGRVILIGCGPGDADLLTLKAQQALQEADVLVIDRLVSPAVLEHARRDAHRIEVGKTPGGPSVSQDEINRIIVREGLKGQTVARLKGGDAFIFGRAAEEIAAARAAGLTVEVVPGITAAHGIAARLGLPLTLRERVRQFSVLTGATADGVVDHDWASLARPGAASAVYMGVGSAPLIEREMIAHGADPSLPVVVAENGTLVQERIVETRLDLLALSIRELGIKGPAIIYLGLDWTSAGLSRPSHVTSFLPHHESRSPESRIAPRIHLEA
jgi:uroporphyrin-III C-methyltransferase/precorrin-2 dehydrogenase/sirohydrochlorin ferrochelatase